MNALTADFRIVKAKTIFASLPEGVPALMIGERTVSGVTVSLCAVGDIGLSGRAAATARKLGEAALFTDVAEALQSADIGFGNLESPLAGDIAPGSMFSAPTAGASALRQSGFTLLHLANNHVGEYGQAGLIATLDAVRDAKITPLGAGDNSSAAMQLVRTDRKGLRIGWLGCGRTLMFQEDSGPRYWELNEQELLEAVARGRPGVDVLIVSMHIGLMYIDYPRPEHKLMAERLMSAGADLILMHHAHVLQGVQVTSQSRVCCYNLGNFLYDWEEGNVRAPVMLREQNEGAIFFFELDQRGITRVAALPTWVDVECRVRWAMGERGRAILNRLTRISRDLEGDFVPAFQRQRADRNASHILKVLAYNIKTHNWRCIIDSIRRIRFEHLKMLMRWFISTRRTMP
jgi:poly-gamma-glutamate synthesis protein (capsule biosynthesis protein)